MPPARPTQQSRLASRGQARYPASVEIADSARKHGIDDLDIWHAVVNAIRVLDQHDRALYIGADRGGRLLEVVVLDDDGQPVAIHAMALRPKFYEHL